MRFGRWWCRLAVEPLLGVPCPVCVLGGGGAPQADPLAAEQAKALEEKIAIGKDNIGHKLLSKMGWTEGEGVGAAKSGITAPVQVWSRRGWLRISSACW